MRHSEFTTARFKILRIQWNLSEKKVDHLHNGNFDEACEFYELEKAIEFLLHLFDETEKIKTTHFELLNIKYIKKDFNRVERKLKLIKLKYSI